MLTTSPLTAKTYFPFLTGLRCLAILWVLIHHILLILVYVPNNQQLSIGQQFCYAGRWGVDLFFVISGFLITGLLLPENNGSAPGILQFYMKRAFKILPSYYFLLVVIFSFSLFLSLHNDPQSSVIKNSIPFYFFFTQNLFHIHTTFLNHLWSIAIEEHFYLFYPLIICLLTFVNNGRFSRSALIIVLIVVIITVNAMRYMSGSNFSEDLLQSTPFRIDGLAAGCLIKLLQEYFQNLGKTSWLNHLFFFATLSFWGVLVLNGAVTRWYFPMLATIASASLIIACLMENKILLMILESASFQFIGKISYNLYLWHYPMLFIAYLLLKQCPALIIPCYIISTFFIGWLITNTLEKYFLQLRERLLR